MPSIPACLLSAALAGATLSCAAAELELNIHGIAKAEGHVLVAVYRGADTWLKGPPLATARVPVSAPGSLQHRFEGLPDDVDVAVSVLHDLNGNGRLDQNAVGMPTEPYGFSNDAVGHFGPPKFEGARLRLRGVLSTQVTLN